MKVWCVFYMDYGGEFKLSKIFSTLEKAHAHVAQYKLHYGYTDIEEFEVDEE